VSTLPDAGRTYASALLDTLDFLSTAQAAVPPLASGLSQLADLKRRLTMIMRGNTPRSLTWPGCVAIITLGLTVLPMLPSLHGQAPNRPESDKSIDEAQKELQAAQADLEMQKAALAQKKALLDQAAKRLAEAKQKAEEQGKSPRHQQFQLALEGQNFQLGQWKKKATYRIEITFSPDEEAMNAKEVIEKIRKIFPERLAKVRLVDESPVEWSLVVPKIHMAPAVEKPAARGVPSGASGSPDKRINELEKKLEKVLQELHELRKQMKESRSRSSATPPSARFRIVPVPVPPGENKPRSTPNPPLDDPYYAPTVPLKPAPVDPARP
jgi:hypothetical protein